jgi:hypothetical protein
LALGAYPERILVQARDDTQDARRIIRDGVDPSAQRKQERRAQRIRAEKSFEVPAREWHANQKAKWTTDHAATILRASKRTCLLHWDRDQSPRSTPPNAWMRSV